jgi:hypothetical protein
MNECVRKSDAASLVTGLILIGVGILFLMDRFHVADVGEMLRMYWPMGLILIGVPQLFRRESMWSGLWFVALGAWFQLVRLQIMGLTFRNSWPLILIVFGAGITLRALLDNESAVPNGEQHDR